MTSRSPTCSAVSARPWVSTRPIDHVDALPLEAVPLAEHGVGLADAGRRAEVDLQPAPLLAADQVEELLGSRAGRAPAVGMVRSLAARFIGRAASRRGPG